MTKTKDGAAAAVASIEDAAACDERADALVSGLLGRVMRRRGTITTALDYVRSLGRDARANCWELAERAGHGLPYRMQGLLGRSRWRWEDLRELLPGLAQDVLGGGPGAGPARGWRSTRPLTCARETRPRARPRSTRG